MDERTKAIDSAVRNFASAWQTATAAYDAGAAAERERWRVAMTLPHYYGGECPDPDQPQARDPNCPACRALLDLGA